nr:hypothetical protein B0A51_05076 [Rachicladosporium sp. CCFEE 5018]
MALDTAAPHSDIDITRLSIQSNARSASSKVLDTPELLEQILLYLPRLDVLLLKCTNSTFQNTIGSPAVQEHSLIAHARGVRCDLSIAAFRTAHGHNSKERGNSDLTSIELDWAPLLAQSFFINDTLHKEALYCLRVYDNHIDYSLWYRHSTAQAEIRLLLPDFDEEEFNGLKVPRTCFRRVGRPEMSKKFPGRDFRQGWTRLKLLRVALPMKIIISYDSAGVLFGPQRNPLEPWEREAGEIVRHFSADDANIGNLLRFWNQVLAEYIRVNSGEFSIQHREDMIAEMNKALNAVIGAGTA